MSSESTAARELTHRLIARERAPANDPDAAAAAARHACDGVSVEFSRWVGARGYDAVMARALVEARGAHPPLEQIHYQLRPAPGLTGVADSIARHGAGATADGLAVLLETIFGVLTRLIGNDLVATLVEKSIENGRSDDAHRERHLDQRSAAP